MIFSSRVSHEFPPHFPIPYATGGFYPARVPSLHKIIHFLIALIWLVNGLICKVLDLVPRHRQIVAAILGEEHSLLLTRLIGISEIAMAAWVLSGIARRLNAVLQIATIATMNVLEFFLVPDLLLFARWNALFAFLLIIVIYHHEFGPHRDFARRHKS